jgi:tetratricopeptide (TPR) repeat protein
LLLLPLLFLFAGNVKSQAQARYNADSATAAQRRALEMQRAQQKHVLDSSRVSRQHILDSTRAARKIITDSLQARRAYRESKHFKDSVTRARAEHVADIREAQKNRLDSVKDVRQRYTDSVVASREAATAQRRKIQEHRTDSLQAIQKYRNSKRFADSVAIYRQAKLDSVHNVRKLYSDSLTSVRKMKLDSLKSVRKMTTDSLTAVRKVRTDSLNAVKKQKADALAKSKENKLRDKKQKEKETEHKQQLAIQLKINKKRSVYSNENMLKKKWSAPRRAFQNTYTHYNYYFNAHRKMEEAEMNMQRAVKDRWEEQIALYPFDPLIDSTMFAADMDSVIQKVSLGIQIHDPRTKWGDDLYLLLGKAYYYKGDVDNALSSFRYIIALRERAKAELAKKNAYKNKTVSSKSKEEPSFVTPEDKSLLDFLKRDPANNEGLLWLARTYTAYGKYSQSEAILDLLTADSKFPQSLKGRLALEKAFLAMKTRNYGEATNQLTIVSADKEITDYMRRRAAYLNGQLLYNDGKYEAAAKQFAQVSDLHPKIDMDFYARRNQAYSLMNAGGLQKDAIASLKNMLHDGKFAPYYEQVYYVLGRLSANGGNPQDAIAYLQQGIHTTKTTKKQKALSFAALGNIYFNEGEYTMAKSAYDSVLKLNSYASDDSSVVLALRRHQVVDKVAEPTRIIRQQDSLLALGTLSDREQRAIVQKTIKHLEALRSDSAFQADNPTLAGPDANAQPDSKNMNWYFANQQQMQQGLTDFKKKWGNRPSVDNWRRAGSLTGSAAQQANSSGSSSGSNDNNSTAGDDMKGIPSEESLLAFIPKTPEARATATSRLQRAYVDLASAYVRQLEDYTHGKATLDTVDKRWTKTPYTAEAMYLRYLIALRRNNLQEAQTWSNKLQSDYPETSWAAQVAPPPGSSDDQTPMTASVGEYYDATYDLLQKREYGAVLARTRNAKRQFPADTRFENRFSLLEAMAYAGSAEYRKADTLLSTFLREHATDSLRPYAEQVLAYVKEKNKADTVAATVPATLPVPATKPADSSNAVPAATTSPEDQLPPPAQYKFKAQEVHYFVIAFNKMEPRAMGVKAGLNDMNSLQYSEAHLENSIEPLPGGRALIIVKSFKTLSAARNYLNAFRNVKSLMREFQANEYQLFVISAPNYRKLITDKNLEAYLNFYRSYY